MGGGGGVGWGGGWEGRERDVGGAAGDADAARVAAGAEVGGEEEAWLPLSPGTCWPGSGSVWAASAGAGCVDPEATAAEVGLPVRGAVAYEPPASTATARLSAAAAASPQMLPLSGRSTHSKSCGRVLLLVQPQLPHSCSPTSQQPHRGDHGPRW